MKDSKFEKPSWLKIKKQDLEKLVVDLGKNNKSPAQIGIILRDKHGIPKSKLIGNKISHILKENNINIKTPKVQTEEKIKKIKIHFDKNKHDYSSQRALTKKLWVLNKIEKQSQ